MRRLSLFSLIVFVSLYRYGQAGSLNVTVKDNNGALVSDAVVYAKAGGGRTATPKKQTVIDQRDKQFVPYVTAVQVGTSIMFPNSDDIRHHVYSFSPAKKFELPLYHGTPAEPVTFDKVGFVTLGCNIHDWMVAYVAVLPTPYFDVTGKNGRVLLKDLPAGQYSVEVWQPSLKGTPESLVQDVTVAASGEKQLLFTLDLKPDFRAKRAPGLLTGGYR
jgi:plastocyanin